MGKRRPTPNALVVTFKPGAACWRLYSLRSTLLHDAFHQPDVQAQAIGDLARRTVLLDISLAESGRERRIREANRVSL